jgi:peptide/nickel transport system ATP-binding protein
VGPVEEIYHRPKHPYSQALLASRPSLDPDVRIERSPLAGDPPNPVHPPSGCRFRTRCPFAESVCEKIEPGLAEINPTARHAVACHMLIPRSGHSRCAA